MTLHMETGHRLTGDVKLVGGKSVRFVTDEGGCMFEVTIGKDGRSIEVQAVDTVNVDGLLYAAALCIKPNVSNSVTISTRKYGDDAPESKTDCGASGR